MGKGGARAEDGAQEGISIDASITMQTHAPVRVNLRVGSRGARTYSEEPCCRTGQFLASGGE